MSNYVIMGILCLIAGATTLVVGVYVQWRYLERKRSLLQPADKLTHRLRAHALKKRSAAGPLLITIGTCALLLGAALLSMHVIQTSPPAPDAVDWRPGIRPEAQQPPSEIHTATSSALWPLVIGSIAMMAIGGVILLIAPSAWPKAVGAAMVVSGLFSNFHLANQVKFDDLVKIDIKVDKPKAEFNFGKDTREGTIFGPEHLATLDDFKSGEATLREHMQAGVSGICQRWAASGGNMQKGILLIVGSTDRVRLNRRTQIQYEANAGLAQARAERIKSALSKCGVPTAQMVTLISGPRHTTEPDSTLAGPDRHGHAEDRSVSIFALWNQNKGVSSPSRP